MPIEWTQIFLVLSGSVGPLAIAVVNATFNRRMEVSRWKHTERDAQRDMYAHFIASANQLVADWLDYETLAPKTIEEERKLDEVHDAHYHELVILSSMVRITATPDIVQGAEMLLGAVRKAKKLARQSREPGGDSIPSSAWLEIDHDFAAARTRLVNALRRTHGNMDVDEEDEQEVGARAIRSWRKRPSDSWPRPRPEEYRPRGAPPRSPATEPPASRPAETADTPEPEEKPDRPPEEPAAREAERVPAPNGESPNPAPAEKPKSEPAPAPSAGTSGTLTQWPWTGLPGGESTNS